MSSNVSLNLAKMTNVYNEKISEQNSEESNSVMSSVSNQSMSILNCSLNVDSSYISNNVYSEHKSVLMKSKISGFDENIDLNQYFDKPAEQLLDYLVNLNKLLKVKTQSYRKKFLRWKEMNYYKVNYIRIGVNH